MSLSFHAKLLTLVRQWSSWAELCTRTLIFKVKFSDLANFFAKGETAEISGLLNLQEGKSAKFSCRLILPEGKSAKISGPLILKNSVP
jgi:hypothetical protein